MTKRQDIEYPKINYDWVDQANCRGLPTSWFFIKNGQSVKPEVKQACETCPVKQDCLDHALKYEAHGFWGGTSEKQRKRLRASLNIKMDKPESRVIAELSAMYFSEKMSSIQRNRVRKTPKKVAECGTRTGYTRHRRLKEAACDDCKKANSEKTKEIRLKKLAKQNV